MTQPQKYRKKPVEIEAMEFGPTAPEAHALTCWMEENGCPGLVGNALHPQDLRYPDRVSKAAPCPDRGWYINPASGFLVIRTLEGDMQVIPGDWVIRGVQGEFYPCKPDIFEATYEVVT